MVSVNRSIGRMAVLFAAGTHAACGSGDGDDLNGGPDPTALSAARSEPSGNGQTGTAGQELANPLRIVILRGSSPAAGVVVTWSADGEAALMTPSVDTTGTDGISTSVWHLGSAPGTQRAQATVNGGADGSPVAFSATTAGPGGGPSPLEIQLRSDGGDRFVPDNVTVPAGTTVTWNWISGIHSVTPTGNPSFPGNALVSAPSTFSHTFNTPGTYLYFCIAHGSPSSGMRGTIVVQ